MSEKESLEPLRWFFCGGFAGLSVDLALYPIDTIKTRIQSENGFAKSGGFKNIYKGIGAVALGAAPGSAAFFVTYKKLQELPFNDKMSPLRYALYASIAEISACIVRVPTEHIKQLAQTSRYKEAKEVIFQHPLESAIFGSIAGSFSAFLTTPLDVAKTRIMLDINNVYKKSILNVWKSIIKNEKPKQLFAGAIVRTMWIGLGGFIYFFGYEFSMKMWEDFIIKH
ncbi:S-adenosylmethionine mitochondrial carrier protein [Strongyloides ratti]|uniref:S-adenosylmethionine mitochondrial carrier protein n=1 Tax=Strongyloides ratti TaxID=34506 RepID=A0A090LE57_STRRB|nr:S-adenosylmethionine mitochondrial carrier protein [Strongyloides ratti]CEF66428.1 S-adenosylmethionine mitochondrial carrier protein [Strongyloides ratti]